MPVREIPLEQLQPEAFIAEQVEAVRAAVVLKPGRAASPDEIIAFCRENLAAYKAPKQVDFLDELPKTATGKIQRYKLRAMAAAERQQ